VIQSLYDEISQSGTPSLVAAWGFGLSSGKQSRHLCLVIQSSTTYIIEQTIPATLPINNSAFIRFVLGAQDDIIKTKTTIWHNSNPKTDYDITIKRLAHQIPIDVFEQETKLFFYRLSYRANNLKVLKFCNMYIQLVIK
jgi:hypothetical protein